MITSFIFLIKFIKYLIKAFLFNGFLDILQIRKHYKLFSEWHTKLILKKTAFELNIPWINVESYEIIKDILNKNATTKWNIFEYGTGGSTYFFLSNNTNLTSVEHDEEWFKAVKKKNIKSKNWECIYCAKDESFSIETMQKELYASLMPGYEGATFYKYSSTIDVFPDEYFDLILIDGRARNACLHHAHSKVKKNGYLILDNGDRLRYAPHELLPKTTFKLIYSRWSPSICDHAWTKTLIYQKEI